MTSRTTRTSLVVAVLMIAFGLAEIATGFRHRFFGLTTTESVASTVLGAGLGACYASAGVLLLTGRRRALLVAGGFLVLDVVGRIAMVVYGLYPLGSFRQSLGIVAGTLIAAAFAGYVLWKWRRA
jgi:hypothetical protein